MLTARLADTDPSGFRTREAPGQDGDIMSAFIEFETAVGRGVGHLRLKGDQAWTLLTAMQEIKGFEERKGPTRVLGAVHGSDPDTRSWAEKRLDEELSLGYADQPYIVVVGGGQGGIALGARLRQLGVPAIVVDRHERAGDQWRKRYKSLFHGGNLHQSRHYSLYLGLQLKARYEGIPTPAYGLQEVHHLS